MQKNKPTLKIIPLGGVSEVGKNMTVLEYGDDIMVIDCGLVFPREDMLGVDYVIPDFTYLVKNREKIRGFVITHGHEDHIGAIPYVFKDIHVPIFATKLTLGLIKTKLEEHHMNNVVLNCIKAGDRIKLGCFTVEFIQVNHSIAGAVGLGIRTPVGNVVHTGDFKIDYTPVDDAVIDLNRFARYGHEGVLALMSDSTNAERPGMTISERALGHVLEDYIKAAPGRVIVASFASNIHRMQQIVDISAKYGRKICFTGRSMDKISNMGVELGYLNIPQGMLLDLNHINRCEDNEVTILTTGSQGEPMSALTRMASSEFSRFEIKEGDTVIISATPIPGNEKMVSSVINRLFRKGVNVIYGSIADVHVSGHACKEELKLILELTKPKFFIPVHGEYRHLYNHQKIAEELGMPSENIVIPDIGNVIELTRRSIRVTGSVTAGSVLIDGSGIGDVGNVVLRDRKLLSEEGLMMVVLAMSQKTGELVSGPEILSRGFVYVRESEEMFEEAKRLVHQAVLKLTSQNVKEWTNIKNTVKNVLKDYLYRKTKRNPMILTIVIDV